MAILYHCKKCKDGAVFSWSQPAPCTGESLLYTDPKNPCEYFEQEDGGNGDGGKDPLCLKKCREERRTCRQACPPGHQGRDCRQRCNSAFGDCKGICPDVDGDGEDGECPYGRGDDHRNCACGKKYVASGANECIAGYVWVPKRYIPEGGYCECSQWCMDIGFSEDCMTNLRKDEEGEEFEWSGELEELLRQLRERIGYLFDYPRGLSDEERQSVINYMTRGIKLGERGRRESQERKLARMGMLDSGLALEKEEELGRETRQLTSGARMGVGVDEINRRFQELMGTTGQASQLIQQLLGSEQLVEVLSAGRRGEGREDLSLFIDYIKSLLGTQTAGQQPYYQALMNYMTQMYGGAQGSGPGLGNWLPYMLYYLIPQSSGDGGDTGEGWV